MKSIKQMQSMVGQVTPLKKELREQIRENEKANRKIMELEKERGVLTRDLADTTQSLEHEKVQRQVSENEARKLKDILSRAHETLGNSLKIWQQDE
jgi:RNA polymerase-binding transcription factor DksA